ncbi:MAG: hypothetical protein LLG04_01700 [Parachlamydia sp.]|nr:hypothetical protein [Parachlamydia sp.]
MNSMKYFLSAIIAMTALSVTADATCKNCQTLPAYERKITAVDVQDKGSSLISLDDGSSWEIVGFLVGKDSDVRKWKKGDEIDLYWSPPKSKGIFCINNRQNDGQPIVLLRSDSLNSFPTIVEILKDGEYIKLSDNSLWEFSWWGKTSTKHWKYGQHVLVQGTGKRNNYSLANLDLSDDSIINIKFAHASFIKFEN